MFSLFTPSAEPTVPPSPVSAAKRPEPPAAVIAPPPPAPVEAPASELAAAPARAPAFRQDHKSLYKQLLRGLYDAVLVTDPKGHVLDSNGRVQNAFQYDSAEIWDMDIFKLIPGLSPQLLERVRQGLAENRHVLIDARCIRKDGSAFPAEVAISSIDLINEGDMVFSVRNVERRKRQSQQLCRFQNALSNDLSSVAVSDAAGQISYVNRTLLTLWGYEKDEQLIGKPLSGLWTGDSQADAPLRRALAGERWLGTLHAAAQDGRRFHVGAAMEADRSQETREIVGLVCSFVEVRES